MALHPGPHTPPLGVLVLPASLSRPHSSLSRPHPALVFISPGPGRAQIRQALGTMAALGDGQEPPRVPSPVSLESLRTPGAHHHEAQLSLRSHQHGTCLPPPPPPPACGWDPRQPTGPWGSGTLRFGSGCGLHWLRLGAGGMSNGSLGDSPSGPRFSGGGSRAEKKSSLGARAPCGGSRSSRLPLRTFGNRVQSPGQAGLGGGPQRPCCIPQAESGGVEV